MERLMAEQLANDDRKLVEEAEKVKQQRKEAGLEGLTGGLECVVINVDRERFRPAVGELVDTTGLELRVSFEHAQKRQAHLGLEGCADFIITARLGGKNPFLELNRRPKTAHMEQARLETFVYSCEDLSKYVAIQKKRGVPFATEGIVETDKYSFIQTMPSRYTGNSIGFIQWKKDKGDYLVEPARPLDMKIAKPKKHYLSNIFELDHTATRVRAEERDAAILEFMRLTDYDFDFSFHVDSLNSITNVARLSPDDYAQVFTSGIKPFRGLEESGPTERYIYNYGTRVHHMAFRTENIEETFDALKADGMEFLVELVGSKEDGLKQTFTQSSPHTFLVNEYIHRYGDFDGFFARSNVTELTRATEKQ
jgi:4-hydroxyphenylpyruvate dioxygenase-like putative hemolysin